MGVRRIDKNLEQDYVKINFHVKINFLLHNFCIEFYFRKKKANSTVQQFQQIPCVFFHRAGLITEKY